MSFAEFLAQPWDRRAEVLIASVDAGHSKCWPAYHHARGWLTDWRGRYHTPEAQEAARGRKGQGWAFAVEWSGRTWRTEIRRALERGDAVPDAVRMEAGL
jgi:hypothetical protein